MRFLIFLTPVLLVGAGCASNRVQLIRPKDNGNILMPFEASVDSAGPVDMVEIHVKAPEHFIVDRASSTLGPESALPGSESMQTVHYKIAENAPPGCITIRLTRTTGNRNIFPDPFDNPELIQFAVLPEKKRKMDWLRGAAARRKCARDLKREKGIVAEARESHGVLFSSRVQERRRKPSSFGRAKLIEMLENSDFQTRFNAAYSLRGKYNRKAVLVLIEGLRRDETISDAAWALGRSRANALDGVPALTQALSRKKLSDRVAAAVALSKIAPDVSVGIAVLLQGLEREETFHDSISALVRIRGNVREVVPVLSKSLSRGNLLDRLRVADALSQIAPDAPDGVDVLIEGARSDSPDVSSFAVRALGRLRPQPPKLKEFLTWAIGRLRGLSAYRAMQALQRSDGSTVRGAIKALLERSRSNEVQERLTAVVLLEVFGKRTPDVIGRLTELVYDPSDLVSPRAAWALVTLDSGGRKSFQVLREALKSERAAVRYGAAVAFRVMKKKIGEVEADLVEAIRDEDLKVARAAAIAFAYAGKTPESAVPSLLKLAETGDDTSREAATYALGYAGVASDAVRDLCAEGLRSEDESVFFYSASCLRTLGFQDRGLIPPLTRALRQKRNGRSEVIRALGAMGRDAGATVGLLSSIYKDAKDYERTQILKSLEKIGTLRAKKELRRLRAGQGRLGARRH